MIGQADRKWRDEGRNTVVVFLKRTFHSAMTILQQIFFGTVHYHGLFL